MARFVKLDLITGRQVFVNPEHVEGVYSASDPDDPNTAVLAFAGCDDSVITVKGKPTAVAFLLSEPVPTFAKRDVR